LSRIGNFTPTVIIITSTRGHHPRTTPGSLPCNWMPARQTVHHMINPHRADC